jgi:hypothetical protein
LPLWYHNSSVGVNGNTALSEQNHIVYLFLANITHCLDIKGAHNSFLQQTTEQYPMVAQQH